MARDFYPFVEGEQDGVGGQEGRPDALVVRHAARVAVYDDPSAAPRVVVIDPKDVRPYLEEITATVSRLAKEQGGSIPFMVIREVVENFIHAYFREPTISILDGGNTIRFSDQGPGIKEKDRALEYGTTSATEEMRRYIRGVGSGLPYAQQYMEDRGGSLTIEDNISGGTIVTISTEPAAPAPPPAQAAYPQAGQGVATAYPASPWQPPAQPQQPWQQAAPTWQQWQQPAYAPQGYPQGYQGYPPAAPQQPWQQPQQAAAWPAQQAAGPAAPPPASGQPAGIAGMSIDEREAQALSWLAQHEMVGPTELAATYGRSQATWSRVLQRLDAMGLTTKQRGGQKRLLTDAGRAWMAGQGR